MLDPQVPPQLLYGLSVGVGDGANEGDMVDVGDMGDWVGEGPAITISTPVSVPARLTERALPD